jgi:hypothetical protein
MTTMKQFRWFWAWDDEKEEAWLSEMAQKGWHFQSAALPGYYTFEYGQPRDDVYRLDYFPDFKDKADYLQLFLDAGWDYKGQMNGWQYFRKETHNGEAPQIFSDAESKTKKYWHILITLAWCTLLVLMNIFQIPDRKDALAFFLFSLMTGFVLFVSYAAFKLLQRINELKKKI